VRGGHSHHHHESRLPGEGRSPFERAVWIAVVACAAVTLVGLIAYWPRGDVPGTGDPIGLEGSPDRAVIRSVEIGPCGSDDPNPTGCQTLTLEVTSGQYDGLTGTIQFSTGPGNPKFSSGDKILVDSFADVSGERRFAFNDFQRSTPLLVLTVLFVTAVLLLGRWRGLGALGGLAASLLVLTVFLLPSLLRGNDAVTVALVGSSVIAFLALYLAHGVTVLTSIALLGTFASLALIGVLASVFSAASKLTGLTDEYATILPALGLDINLKGIVLAGIVIGSLGVLDDVTVTQVSAVAELRAADPDATSRQLYGRALNIGRDHIASTVNTLFLAYAGAALPLLLLFTSARQAVGSIATREIVAVEIIRSLVGSIGLVASVPITTWMAARVLAGRPPSPSPSPSPSPPTQRSPTTSSRIERIAPPLNDA